MNFDIQRPGIGTPAPTPVTPQRAAERAAPAARSTGASFARVYELEEARRRRDVPLPPIAGDQIPPEVWDEVDKAARLVEQLAGEGRRVVFDQDRLSGKVVAGLIEADGSEHGVPLAQAVDPAAVSRASATPLPTPPVTLSPRFGTE